MMLTAYTDGSCLGNPGPGGWAVVLTAGPDVRSEASGGDPKTTNNRMELLAAVEALERSDPAAPLRIVTDSKHVCDGATQWRHAWKRRAWRTSGRTPVKNRDLWERLDALCQSRTVEWQWVRGHAGNAGNERADLLARAAAETAARERPRRENESATDAQSLTGSYTIDSLVATLQTLPGTATATIHGRIEIR